MAKDDIYQVRTTFVITLGDRDVEYHTGELVDGNDPAFKRVPEHFGPVEFKHRQAPDKGVEQATASPGEKRDEPQRGHALTTKDIRPSKRG